MKKAKFLFIIALWAVIACNNDKTQTITIDGKYALTVPESMKQAKGLNEDASLQYQDASKEMYVIVIDETKKSFDSIISAYSLYDVYKPDLEGYSQLVINGIDPSVTIDTTSGFQDTKINGLNARRTTIEGSSSGFGIYWKFAFLEGKKNFYQVMAWTTKDRKEKNEKQMEDIITSFKETDKSIR